MLLHVYYYFSRGGGWGVGGSRICLLCVVPTNLLGNIVVKVEMSYHSYSSSNSTTTLHFPVGGIPPELVGIILLYLCYVISRHDDLGLQPLLLLLMPLVERFCRLIDWVKFSNCIVYFII